MRLPVQEIEMRPNYWPLFCKSFPHFSRRLGNKGPDATPKAVPLTEAERADLIQVVRLSRRRA